MAVPIIENWADISGGIEEVVADRELSSYSRVAISVDAVEAVEDFPNLLEDVQGERIEVLFPDHCVDEQGVEPGKRVACRVRRAGVDRIFVHRERIDVSAAERPNPPQRKD